MSCSVCGYTMCHNGCTNYPGYVSPEQPHEPPPNEFSRMVAHVAVRAPAEPPPEVPAQPPMWERWANRGPEVPATGDSAELRKAGETRYDWFDEDESTYTPIMLGYKVRWEATHDLDAMYARIAKTAELRAKLAEAERVSEQRYAHMLDCEKRAEVAEASVKQLEEQRDMRHDEERWMR